ncbi:MAG: DUF2273 domain-containing protein [Bacillaceae bacterium]|nr:DUF2273 domain-containing protein [Bacillaceae bacterium]
MFWKLMEQHAGKFLGLVAGIVLGVVYLAFGFLDTVVFFVIVATAVYLGNKYDKKEDLADVLDRILPGKFTKQ